MRNCILATVLFATCLLVSSCGSRKSKSSVHVEHSPSWGIVSETKEASLQPEEPHGEPIKLDYKPKASFTSIAYMESLFPSDEEEYKLGTVNKKFLKGCYYTGDTSTLFLASFAERWNRNTFLRRFVNAEELFARENANLGDSLTTEPVRGKMPMLPNELQLAFQNAEIRSKAQQLVKLFSTIDYTPEQTERMVDMFNELVKLPYDTPEYATDDDITAIKNDFWPLYDKEPFVKNIADIQKTRADDNTSADKLTKLGNELKRRYVKESDFDTRCILALEIGCCNDPDDIDYLGELMEDGRYSKYLLEVWVSWRLRVQSEVFGISTYSEIPDNLYDRARLLVAQRFLQHLEAKPDDTLAKVLLLNLSCIDNLHRAGGIYGNEALGASSYLRQRCFLPPELEKENDQKRYGHE